MDKNVFRTTVADCLLENGFRKERAYFYQSANEVICAISLQRSTFSNGYYISVGYVFRQLHPEKRLPRDVDGDIRTRFGVSHDGISSDLFDLDKTQDQEELQTSIAGNLERLVKGKLSLCGMKELCEKHPALLYQATVDAKHLLGVAKEGA